MQSLCETCASVREVLTPNGSRFLLCQLAQTDPAFPKYPPQPVVRCAGYQLKAKVIPLHADPCFTFRFADDRLIPRFHLEGVPVGRRVSVFRIDPATGERRGLLATATVGDGGWVDLPQPLLVRDGEAFVAVPDLALTPAPECG